MLFIYDVSQVGGRGLRWSADPFDIQVFVIIMLVFYSSFEEERTKWLKS